MIVAFSTSSPLVSIAFFDLGGHLRYSESVTSQRNASSAIFKLLEAAATQGFFLADVDGFVADGGPGSFTGVKVGVTVAKSLGYAFQKMVAIVQSFDLVSANSAVAIPNKRGEWFLREPSQLARLVDGQVIEDAIGYGDGYSAPQYPNAGNAAQLTDSLNWMEPELAKPLYLIEPSISTPKRVASMGDPIG